MLLNTTTVELVLRITRISIKLLDQKFTSTYDFDLPIYSVFPFISYSQAVHS